MSTVILLPEPEAKELYSVIMTPGGEKGDSGVDLRFPQDVVIPPVSANNGRATVVGLQVRARLVATVFDVHVPRKGEIRIGSGSAMPYMITPRSSIAKTPLSLANSVGIIDAGYTGELKVGLRNHSSEPYTITRGTSLFQIVAADLAALMVDIVEPDSKYFAETVRGAGGFGSTGAEGSKK
jgi:dUTP pyrophosphatase